MFLLIALLERFAHLLPQTLRVELGVFIAERLLRALDSGGFAIPFLARHEIRLRRLLVVLAITRWRWLNGLPEDRVIRATRIPLGQIARDRAVLRARLIDLWQAFSDLDYFIVEWRRARLRIVWKRFTRTPRRMTGRLIAMLSLMFSVCAARSAPARPRVLELSG